jgi:hypothetical protein
VSVTRVELIKETYGWTKDSGALSGTRIYRVDVDSLDDDSTDAYVADDGTTSIPSSGDAWKVGSSLKVVSKQVDGFEDHQLSFQVTVGYSSKSDNSGAEIENPLARPAQYNYGSSQSTEPYFRDTDAAPCVNSAGDDFADLPQRERSRARISITRNTATFNHATAYGYINKINASGVSLNGVSYAERTLRIVNYGAQGPSEENGVTYWVETIEIDVNEDTWDDKFEDRGLAELASGKRKPILDATNHPITTPWPLDGAGAKKASPANTPAIITRKPYQATSFASL